MPSATINALKRASKGLLFPSESDEPFAVFTWEKADGNLTPQRLRMLAKHDEDDPIQEQSLEELFKDLTTEQDWHGRKEKAQVKKFRVLEQTLRDNLSDLKVFRVGERNIDVYIVGQTPDGEWAGLKTRAVET